jgi:hypothetical protein
LPFLGSKFCGQPAKVRSARKDTKIKKCRRGFKICTQINTDMTDTSTKDRGDTATEHRRKHDLKTFQSKKTHKRLETRRRDVAPHRNQDRIIGEDHHNTACRGWSRSAGGPQNEDEKTGLDQSFTQKRAFACHPRTQCVTVAHTVQTIRKHTKP